MSIIYKDAIIAALEAQDDVILKEARKHCIKKSKEKWKSLEGASTEKLDIGETCLVTRLNLKKISKEEKSPAGRNEKGQSNQKWEEMLNELHKYIKQQKLENDPDWTWDGNVPTHYKTKDGKALGRWIGNQRAAKHKQTLKPDREQKLMRTGLKWTVLSTNAWDDMLNELHIYVASITSDGEVWNGNVPTNYKIKNSYQDEEKNLGRWINRQRSLYQCGRLREDRQFKLEQIGLKWSVLSNKRKLEL